MSYALGVDIGTSFVTTAVARPGDDGADPPMAHGAARFSAALLVDEHGVVRIGGSAEESAAAAPDRVIRGIVDRIGDPVSIAVGGRRFPPERLYALLVSAAVDRVTAGEGAPPAALALVVPDRWGPHRVAVVRGALAAVGCRDVSFVSSADAAATVWQADRPQPADAATVVYDLSADRCGVTVIRTGGGRTRTLAFDGVGRLGTGEGGGAEIGVGAVGGRVVDDAILRHVVASARELFVGLDTADSRSTIALAALRRDCTRAKELLATAQSTPIPVRLPSASGDVLLSRTVLERIVEPTIRPTLDAVGRALRTASTDAGVTASELDAILLVGGSSSLPGVARLLHDEFGIPVETNGDPTATAARGASMVAVRDVGPATSVQPGGSIAADRGMRHPSPLARFRRSIGVAASAVAAATVAMIGVSSTVDDGHPADSDASGAAG